MRRFHAPPENFTGENAWLNSDETKHLRDVLRLRAGDEISVFNGAGREYLCRIESVQKHRADLKVVREISPKSPESNLQLTLGVALLKGEKFDLVIQKAVELGVQKIIPLETARADIRIKDSREIEKKLERWRRIMLEAAKQSGRASLAFIETPVKFESFTEQTAKTKILFAERNGTGLADLKVEKDSEIIVAVGAEGGWEDSEIERAREKDFQIVTLGGRVLRAETAAIVVCALLQNHFGDLR